MTEMNTHDRIASEIMKGERDYEEVYRIPASEDWPWGEEVGFVETDGWFFAVNWLENGGVCPFKFAIEPDTRGVFPGATEWMITNNSAIDYGLTKDE